MSRVPEMPEIKDQGMGDFLRTLPRTRASDGFTGRVLSRVDERVAEAQSRAGAARRRRIALAAAVVVGIAASVWFGYERRVGPFAGGPTAARVEQMRNEYREIQGEVQKLRELADELSPMLELGGNDELGFVFDLRELDERRGSDSQPASLR